MYKVNSRARVGSGRIQPRPPVNGSLRSDHGETMRPSLIEAIERGFFQQVRYLIELGADVDERDETGRTPLMLCAFIEDSAWGVGLARTLIEKGASGGFRDLKGLNVFHYACVYERVELTRTLLNAIDFDLNQGDKHGNTPLHYAADSGNAYITKIIIDALHRYKTSADKPNRYGVTPLIQAWKSGQVICANIIANYGNADEDWRDYVESKSAKEWRDEAIQNMSKILARRQKQASLWNSPLNSKRKSRFKRSITAPKARPRLAWLENENRQAVVILENELLAMKDFNSVIRSASEADMKARLEHTLGTSHVETFITQLRPRPKTAGYSLEYDNHKNDKNNINNAVALMTERSTSSCDSVTNCWKNDIRFLFHALQYQCTGSFRPSVRVTSHNTDLDLHRPSSPNPSETASDDHQSNSSRKSSRRNSNLSAKGESKRRLPSVTQAMSAASSIGKIKKNSSESMRSSVDSSSTESLATSVKVTPRGKKSGRESRRSSVSTKDDNFDSASQHTDKSSSSSGSSVSSSGRNRDSNPRSPNRTANTQNPSAKDNSASSQRRDSDASVDSSHTFGSPLAAIDESQE